MEIPRHYVTKSLDNCSISWHLFVDASEEAYATALFVRFECSDEILTRLITTKARVALLNNNSVPRIELQAVQIETRLLRTYLAWQRKGKPSSQSSWSDSISVLHFINSEQKRHMQFVAPRIRVIHKNKSIQAWRRYVPSKDNVADQGTKWKDIEFTNPNHPWCNQPYEWSHQQLHMPCAYVMQAKFVAEALRFVDRSQVSKINRIVYPEELARVIREVQIQIQRKSKAQHNSTPRKKSPLVIPLQGYKSHRIVRWQHSAKGQTLQPLSATCQEQRAKGQTLQPFSATCQEQRAKGQTLQPFSATITTQHFKSGQHSTTNEKISGKAHDNFKTFPTKPTQEIQNSLTTTISTTRKLSQVKAKNLIINKQRFDQTRLESIRRSLWDSTMTSRTC